MTGIIAALAIFGAVTALVTALRAGEVDRRPSPADLEFAARRIPRRGARDSYALTGSLGRAPVPHWG